MSPVTPATSESRREVGMNLLAHALGVKLALDLNNPHKAAREAYALLDDLVDAEHHLTGQTQRKGHP